MAYTPNIVILTGAGISAESGIKTFRAADGLWENHRVEDVASPQGFARDPALVYRFYNARREQLLSPEVAPNPAHEALARLQAQHKGRITVVTQNIDDLHERGGSDNVIHMHGELLKARCLHCNAIYETREAFDSETSCEKCDQSSGLRPHIVWFGEMPLYMDEISDALVSCDVFAAIGTSGHVYPAAGFVDMARHSGAKTIEFNIEETGSASVFHDGVYGPAGETIPQWVESLLA